MLPFPEWSNGDHSVANHTQSADVLVACGELPRGLLATAGEWSPAVDAWIVLAPAARKREADNSAALAAHRMGLDIMRDIEKMSWVDQQVLPLPE